MRCTPCVQANCNRIKCCVGRQAALRALGLSTLNYPENIISSTSAATVPGHLSASSHLNLFRSFCDATWLSFPEASSSHLLIFIWHHLETSIWRTHAWKTARVWLPSLSNWSSVFQQWVSFVEQERATDLSQHMQAGVPTGPNPVTSILLPSNTTSPLSRLLWSNLNFLCFWHERRASCSSQSERSSEAPHLYTHSEN